MEALPVCADPAMLSLHYTLPKQEVLPKADIAHAIFDIADYDLPDDVAGTSLKAEDVRVGQTMRVSISFDVQKVDE